LTLKGKHYNVKFLSGYGLSIKLKDNHIVLTNGSDPFTKKVQEPWLVTKIPYETIVISGQGYVSTQAIQLLTKNNISILQTDIYGNPISFMNGIRESNIATQYRIGQYDTFRDKRKREYLQKQIVSAKIQSQIDFFTSLNKPELKEAISKLHKFQRELENNHSIAIIEAKASRIYFLYYSKLIPERLDFTSRRGGGLSMRKRYAGDVINSLLNYGYSVLASYITKYVNAVGLDAYYGFFHKSHSSYKSLVYDIIEPFRWLVEFTVIKLSNNTKKYMSIRKKDYAYTKHGTVVMSNELILRFLEKLQRKFQSSRIYKNGIGRKMDNGMSHCQEITIPKIVIQNLAEFCVEKRKEFEI